VTRDQDFLSSGIFLTFKIPCNHKDSGCLFEGAVDDLIAHEQSCRYRSKQCDSPLCRNYFKPAERPLEHDTVCSLHCGLLSKVYFALQKNDSALALKSFEDCFEPLRAEVKKELQAELALATSILDTEALELAALEGERKAMMEELDMRTANYHIGRWSPVLSSWSCCKSKDIYSVGCRELR
jgi:hypothetical protein